ncbi:MAG: putative N-acetylmannosamine-6-phosphate 2-epimerase [Candidatus Eremiobacteraeota bacterium]|nr:putative N-acetylmannosamine-6-phosphate 2-epimerase [Candidatus Eremiobacteraeota bacterium]
MGLLAGLRGGLIVSVQAWKGSALDDPYVIAAMARAAQDGGAVAVRIAGAEQIRAVRARVSIPIVGLVKRAYDGFAPYITPTLDDVAAVAAAGAEIVAFDATSRGRPGGITVADITDAVASAGCVAMADCATASDAARALAAGAHMVATTLCGYTPETAAHALPALGLVREMAQLDTFVVCEGGVATPAQLHAALEDGADAVVVGTAITNVDALVRSFAGSADKARNA